MSEKFMKRALQLAKKGLGKTSTNPCVGAVLVKNGKIIGEGWHKTAGQDHAEVEAINDCREHGNNPAGATIYVSLSPCSHQGRTGACTSALVQNNIKKVYAACEDPNPLCKDTASILKKYGIPYSVGLLKDEARALNEPYFKWIQTGTPLITLKIAMSLNGKISGQKGRYITGVPSRKYVHRLRSEADAVLVGINTVLADDPHLGARSIRGRDPLRVILDSRLRIPLDAKVLRNKNFLIFTTKKAPTQKVKTLQKNLIVLNENISLKIVLKELGKRQITHLIIEGGTQINTSFLKDQLADRILFFIAPIIIKKGKDFATLDEGLRLRDMHVEKIGKDYMVEGSL